MVETWLAADARPEISPLHDGLSVVQSPRHDAASASHDQRRTEPPRRRGAPSSDVAVPPRPRPGGPRQSRPASPPTGCSGTTPRPPRVSSNPCAPKTITSDEDLPATSSPPASTCSPRPAPSASRSASNRTTRHRRISTSASASNPTGRPTSTRAGRAKELRRRTWRRDRRDDRGQRSAREHRLGGGAGEGAHVVDHVRLVVVAEPRRRARPAPRPCRRRADAASGRCGRGGGGCARWRRSRGGGGGARSSRSRGASACSRAAPARGPTGDRASRPRGRAVGSGFGRTTSTSGTRSSVSSLAGTPNSAVKPPGRKRTPDVSSPASRSASNAELSEPTRSSPMMSMQPSGGTRSVVGTRQREPPEGLYPRRQLGPGRTLLVLDAGPAEEHHGRARRQCRHDPSLQMAGSSKTRPRSRRAR